MCQVPGTRYQEPCTWYQVPGTWYLVWGTRAPGTYLPATRYQVPGIRYQVSGTGLPRTWYQLGSDAKHLVRFASLINSWFGRKYEYRFSDYYSRTGIKDYYSEPRELKSYQAIYFLGIENSKIIPGNTLSKRTGPWNHTRTYTFKKYVETVIFHEIHSHVQEGLPTHTWKRYQSLGAHGVEAVPFRPGGS